MIKAGPPYRYGGSVSLLNSISRAGEPSARDVFIAMNRNGAAIRCLAC